MKLFRIALPLLVLILPALAQTTYPSSTGTIASTFVTTMNIDGGGSASVNPNLAGCYYPGPCGSANATFSYMLADGSAAYFHPATAHFVSTGGTVPCIVFGKPSTCPVYNVSVDPATAVDSFGRQVTASVTFNLHTVRCVQPRGTCPPKKVYDSGVLTVQ